MIDMHMHEILLTAAVVVLTVGMVIGAAAVTTGWMIPGTGREKVLRPKTWGYGTLLGQAGMGVFLFCGPLGEWGSAYSPFAPVGIAAFFAGTYLQRRAMKTSS